ncbi:YfhO family protein, partial [Streptococcus suis]|uniref:YfhO family protein n=1 Tax=Streptococcus suis TaxID=1307 RepID=UPI00128FE6A2
KQVITKSDGNKVTVDFVTDKEASLLLTLPYDKGWNATIDGKPIKIQKAQEGFMKVDVSPGQTKLVLTFIPNGFYLGLLISFGAVFVFFSYQFIGYYYSKNRES